MSQFDVHRTRGASADMAPFLIVLQADTLQSLNTVIVAPMLPESAVALIKKLHVRVEFQGAAYVVTPEHLVSLPRKLLGPREGSLAAQRGEFIDAVDFIFSGY